MPIIPLFTHFDSLISYLLSFFNTWNAEMRRRATTLRVAVEWFMLVSVVMWMFTVLYQYHWRPASRSRPSDERRIERVVSLEQTDIQPHLIANNPDEERREAPSSPFERLTEPQQSQEPELLVESIIVNTQPSIDRTDHRSRQKRKREANPERGDITLAPLLTAAQIKQAISTKMRSAAIVVMAHSRPDVLNETLRSLTEVPKTPFFCKCKNLTPNFCNCESDGRYRSFFVLC